MVTRHGIVPVKLVPPFTYVAMGTDEADTFVCAGFDDPSREVAARTAHRASLSASLERAEAAVVSDGAATHQEL